MTSIPKEKEQTDVYLLDDGPDERWEDLECKKDVSSQFEDNASRADSDDLDEVVGQRFRKQGQEWDVSNPEWVDCSAVVREHDKTIMENWNNEMDTSLLFSSLFSGIVASFLLAATDYAHPDTEYETLHRKLASIATNVLWFVSLIISINAVLSAILVKQWLGAYAWENEGTFVLSPRVNFAVRHLRFKRLHNSSIPTFIDYLPFQMIVGVGIFYAGLLSYMWLLNPIVAGIGTAFIVGSLSIFIITTYLPANDPLSPYQSIQGWIARRATEYVSSKLPSARRAARLRGFKQDGPKPTSWVDYSLRAVLSDPDAQHESTGLLWLQSSLVAWKPEVVKQSFGCALSLPEGIRAQTLASLCMEYFPSSVLDSDDPKAMVNFALKYGDAVEKTMYVTVYTTLVKHLMMLVDPKETYVSPTRGELVLNIGRILLVMILHPEWIDSRQADGWSLGLALVNSAALNQISHDPRKMLSARIYSTFLYQVLEPVGAKQEDILAEAGSQQLTAAQIQAITFPARWVNYPLPSRMKHSEEDLWIVANGCQLFGLLHFRMPSTYTTRMVSEEVQRCLESMTNYLQSRVNVAPSGDVHVKKAITLWTRILSHRAEGGMRLSFSHKKSELENAPLRDLLDSLAQAAEDHGVDDMGRWIWGLRLLTGTLKTIHEVLGNDLGTAAGDELEPPTPATFRQTSSLSSRLRHFTPQELQLVGDRMLRSFPDNDWRDHDSDHSHRHVLITCLLLQVVSANSQNVRYEVNLIERLAGLLAHDEHAISTVSERKQKGLESVLSSTFSGFGERRRSRKYNVDGDDGDVDQIGPDLRSTRAILLEAVVKQSTLNRAPVFLALCSATLVLLVPWTQCQLSEYPAMQKTLEAMTGFLSRVPVDAKTMGRYRTKSWITLCLQDLRKSLKLNRLAWGTKTTGILGKFMQVLHDRFEFASWSDEERRAFVDVMRESNCSLDHLDSS